MLKFIITAAFLFSSLIQATERGPSIFPITGRMCPNEFRGAGSKSKVVSQKLWWSGAESRNRVQKLIVIPESFGIVNDLGLFEGMPHLAFAIRLDEATPSPGHLIGSARTIDGFQFKGVPYLSTYEESTQPDSTNVAYIYLRPDGYNGVMVPPDFHHNDPTIQTQFPQDRGANVEMVRARINLVTAARNPKALSEGAPGDILIVRLPIPLERVRASRP